ncbi:Inner membrane protein translocase component YidC, long form [Thioalkalivibrio nitratireducens DSM 14787]|uniref:Membrane protein insertase YidC n=1 Tax=Thioalkalivibrio nitratireducens (strain DSM 14787 / UNIQEM 213 / ALEN2) TaxID=1255043 RepID=L0E2C1_THIND|nr:membrane protein insertase YidC [Thioalkalivibrio nitratireducens]AGA35433.1 Inner membrane protein translocase component YidC, long form [Thioalkalivibrio nitratireducens DSM 14787]
MENLRPILWLSLAFVLFLMWQAWNQDYGVRPEPPRAVDPTAEETELPPEDVPEAPVADADALDPGAIPEALPEPTRRHVTVRTDLLDLAIDTRGGTLVRADLLEYPVDLGEPSVPVRLFDERVRGYVAQSGLTHDRVADIDAAARAPSHHAEFRVDGDRFEMIEGQDTLRVPMTWTSDDGTVRVTKTFVFQRGTHLFEVEHRIENLGDQPWIGRQYRQLRHGPTPSRASFFLYTFTGAAYFDGRYNKESFESLRDSPIEQRLQGGWISVIEHYFMSAWVPGEDEVNSMYARAVPGAAGTEYLIGLHSEPLTVAPGNAGEFRTRMWVGPKTQAELREIAQGLELTVDYGIFTFLAKPLFWLLRVIHDFVGNWGWSIVFLTILIKLAFFHLSATSYRSMAKMRAVAPKLQALKERYKDDKQRMNTALMELYKKEKINPLGGCLPILVQIPVFIALYWVLLESVELRQAPWWLWIQDLSTRDPYFILPVLMGLTMIIQYKLNPPPMDPIQKKIFMALPVVFTVFFAFFPAGLVLYWFTNNLFSIGQQYVITRKIDAAGGKKD